MAAEALSSDAARLRRWRILILTSTWWSYAGLYFCRKTFWAVKKPLADELGFDESTLGNLDTAYLVAYAVGQFLAAGLGQRLGARKLLLIGMLVSLVANLVFATSDSVRLYTVFMIVNGIAQATGWSACMGTLGRWTTRGERGTIMGFWATCYQLGGVMAIHWAALWLRLVDWRGSFFAGTAVLFLAWLYVIVGQRNRPEDVGLQPVVPEEGEAAPGAEALASEGEKAVAAPNSPWTRSVVTTLVLVGMCYFGIKFIRYAIWTWSSYFLADYYHLDEAAAADYSAIFDWAGFLGVVFAGYVSDRFFRSRRAGLSFLMLALMTGGCAFLYVMGPQGLPWFVIGMVMVGFNLYGPDSLLSGAAAIEVGSARTAIAAAGIINGIGQLGAVLQSQVVSRVYGETQGQVGPVFAMLFGAGALALVALILVIWRNRSGASDL